MHLKSWQKDLIIVIFFILFPIIATWNVLFSQETFLGADVIDGYLPWRFFLINEILQNHTLPLWNPYALSGTPFLGNIQTSIFYPLTYLMLINSYFMFKILYIINHSIVATGIFFLLKEFKVSRAVSFIFSLSLSMNGAFWTGSLIFAQTFAWVPLTIFFYKKSLDGKIIFIPLTAISLGIQFCGGYPQILWVTILFCLLLTIRALFLTSLKYTLSVSFLIFILFTLLVSAQLIPTLELVLISTRSAGTKGLVETSLQERLNPLFLLFMLFPGILAEKPDAGWYLWGNLTGILIILSLIFAIIPKSFKRVEYKYFLLIAILFSIFISSGDINSLNRFIFSLPIFSFFRHGSQYIIIGMLCLIIISAQGLNHFLNDITSKELKWLGGCFLLFILTLLSIYSTTAPYLIFTLIANLLSVFFLFITIRGFRIYSICIFSAFLIFNSFISMHGHSIPSNFYTQVKNKKIIFDQLKPYFTEPARIISTFVHPNESLFYKLQAVNGYDSVMIGRYIKFYMLASNNNGDIGNVTYLKNPDFRSKLVDILNVKYILSHAEIFHEKLQFITEFNGVFLYQNKEAYPRAYFANNPEFLPDDDIIKRMLEFDYVKNKTIFFESNSKSYLRGDFIKGRESNKVSAAEITFVDYANDKVILNVNNPGDGFLVLADTYYPGWKAFDNGKRTEIFRANYFMRAIKLPSGRHEVIFEYDPWTYKVGVILSILGIIMLLLFYLYFAKKLQNYFAREGEWLFNRT